MIAFQMSIMSPIKDAPDGVTDMNDADQDMTKYRRLAPRNARTIDCNPVVVSKRSVEIHFTFSLPEQCKLTEGVKSRWQCALFQGSMSDGQS